MTEKNKRAIGSAQEQAAAAYLTANGYRILERNFYSRFGEIDMIARHNGFLVFIEVKYRAGCKSESPALAVDKRKQRRICRTADYYRLRHRITEDQPCRFDVVAVTPEQIAVYQNAFDYCI